ncbi:hypothetical protein [Methylobacterium sp. Leaf106]|uniref:hypothetical protein n=1 Tax=Methylobacterium sp. Leaf106 TaxID=1736255 RepID=UPI0006F867CC|nr:hypothetical protein [Methylobacterium sp. Leaf106]KQP53038.1 hypothetical protein ASF34_01310 [Methylobacterium sp. Leaf106]
MSDSRHTHGLIHEWAEIRGLQVVALETVEHPRTISVSISGGPFGWSTMAEIDSTEPGARAKAVSLGDMLNDALEAAELGWFTPDDEIDAQRR